MKFGHDHEGPWNAGPSARKDDDEMDAQERVTNPDLAAAAEVSRRREKQIEAARAELQRKIEDPSTYSRRREVMLRIMQADGLLEDEIKRGAGSNHGGRDVHMEFSQEWAYVVYVYYTKDFKQPYYQMPQRLDPSRRRFSLPHCGATVLIRVDVWNDAITEIHRWEDDE